MVLRPLSLLAIAIATLSIVPAAFAGQATTTRIETRPFYGATVTLEAGVRVFRPLPPHGHIIINPGGRTPLSLNIEQRQPHGHGYVGHGGYGNAQAAPGGYADNGYGYGAYGAPAYGGQRHGHGQGHSVGARGYGPSYHRPGAPPIRPHTVKHAVKVHAPPMYHHRGGGGGKR